MNDSYKRLYRSRSEHQVSGVCGGLGLYFAVDPVLIRLIVAGATLLTGVIPGLLAYAAAWIIIPLEPAPPVPYQAPQAREGSA